MKPLKTKRLLQMDLVIQSTLIAATILCFILLNNTGWTFIFFYFILGSWQVLSFLLHLDRRFSTTNISRMYGNALLVVLLLGLGTYLISYLQVFNGAFLIYLLAMLLVGPILAICYFILCSEDLKQINKTLSYEN